MGQVTSSFPPTDWSLLRHVVGDDEPSVRRLSLEELLRRYMPPMRRFLRQRFRLDEHQADDWLQGFVTSKVLQSPLLSRADRDRGKFRSWLSHALAEYGIDQTRRAQVRAMMPLDSVTESHPTAMSAPLSADPAALFDRHWAEHAIAEALRLTKERLCSTGRERVWDVFNCRMVESDDDRRGYRLLAEQFAFATPTQASTALNTAKRVFRRKLRDVLTEFGADESDLESSVRELKNIFQK